MKYYTHPSTNYTTICYKDGSSYKKNWRYFRPTLILEVSLKAWDFEIREASKYDFQEGKRHKLFIYSTNYSASSTNLPGIRGVTTPANFYSKESFW